MPTLQDIKKAAGLTNADIARALHCGTAKAGMIMQGRHIRVYHDEDIEQLARILGITFERCWLAMCESYNAFMGTPGVEHQRADEVRAEVQAEMQERMPDLGIEIDEPREMATVESVLVVPEERRLAPLRQFIDELTATLDKMEQQARLCLHCYETRATVNDTYCEPCAEQLGKEYMQAFDEQAG